MFLLTERGKIFGEKVLRNFVSSKLQGKAFKTGYLNNSLVFNNRRKSAKQKLHGFKGNYFGHVVFLLGEGVKKI